MSLWPKVFDDLKFQLAMNAAVVAGAIAVVQLGTPPRPWSPAEYVTAGPVFLFANAAVFVVVCLWNVYLLRSAAGRTVGPLSAREPKKALSLPVIALSLAFGAMFAAACHFTASAMVATAGVNDSMLVAEGAPLAKLLLKLIAATTLAGALAAFVAYARLLAPNSSATTA
jgi:hypothetical protein